MVDFDPIIAKLERAKEGSRGLDAAVAVAAAVDLPSPMGEAKAYLKVPHKDDRCELGTYWLVQRSGDSLHSAPAYTTSLDAALTLVPEELSWMVSSGVVEMAAIDDPSTNNPSIIAATTALALCIAALKAMMDKTDG